MYLEQNYDAVMDRCLSGGTVFRGPHGKHGAIGLAPITRRLVTPALSFILESAASCGCSIALEMSFHSTVCSFQGTTELSRMSQLLKAHVVSQIRYETKQ